MMCHMPTGSARCPPAQQLPPGRKLCRLCVRALTSLLQRSVSTTCCLVVPCDTLHSWQQWLRPSEGGRGRGTPTRCHHAACMQAHSCMQVDVADELGSWSWFVIQSCQARALRVSLTCSDAPSARYRSQVGQKDVNSVARSNARAHCKHSHGTTLACSTAAAFIPVMSGCNDAFYAGLCAAAVMHVREVHRHFKQQSITQTCYTTCEFVSAPLWSSPRCRYTPMMSPMMLHQDLTCQVATLSFSACLRVVD